MGVWEFIQDQVLGMKWLNELIGNVLSMMGLDVAGRVGGSVQFYIYDVLKIMVLLCVLIFLSPTFKVIFRQSGASAFWGVFTGFGLISCLPYWGRSRLFVPARPFPYSLALPVRGCPWA